MIPSNTDKEGEALAKRFHDVYELLAPKFGYKTREESAVSWEDVPENNRKLMIATVNEVLWQIANPHPSPTPKSSDSKDCPIDRDGYHIPHDAPQVERESAETRPTYTPPTDTGAETMIKHMVNRFLGWSLPDDFAPDAGISFKSTRPFPPTGTNLFTGTQAEAMIRYLLDGAPQTEAQGVAGEDWPHGLTREEAIELRNNMGDPAGEFEEAAKRLDAKAFRYGSLTPGVKHGVNITDAKTILRQALNRQAKAHLADKEKAVREARVAQIGRIQHRVNSYASVSLTSVNSILDNELVAIAEAHQLDEDGNDNP